MALPLGACASVKLCAVKQGPSGRHGWALNPTWDRLDPNGLPVNPAWLIQSDSKVDGEPFCVARPAELCGGFPIDPGRGRDAVASGNPQCTDFAKAEWPADGLLHELPCRLGMEKGRFYGHVNWLPALYQGFIFFESHAFPDDDYNFALVPAERIDNSWRLRRPGLTPGNHLNKGLVADKTARKRLEERGLNYGVHIEMMAKESVDHFTQNWWTSLRDHVRDGGPFSKAARDYMSGLPGVAMGLFGLDSEHDVHSELHPAYMVAVQTQCARRPESEGELNGFYVDKWAVMLRNTGTQGWCSAWDKQHWVRFPGNTFTLRLPIEFFGMVGEVKLWEQDFRSNRAALEVAASGVDEKGVLVTFRWSTEDEFRLHGTMTVAWKPAGDAAVRQCATLSSALGLPTPPGLVAAAEEVSASEDSDLLSRLNRAMNVTYRSNWCPPGGSSFDQESVTVLSEIAMPSPPGEGPCPGNLPCEPSLRSATYADVPLETPPHMDALEDCNHDIFCAGLAEVLAGKAGKLDKKDGKGARSLQKEWCK